MFHFHATGALVSLLVVTAELAAATIYVDDSAIGGANNGTSWANAYVELHQALAAAQGGDEIRIGEGTYKPARPGGNRTATFLLVSSTLVQGGYAGFAAPDPDDLNPAKYPTILSGDLNGNDGGNFAGYAENSYHVVVAIQTATGTRLQGVTIRGGNASQPDAPHTSGGGIKCVDALLTIRDCIIEDNQAFRYGGGIDGSGTSGGNGSVIWMERTVVQRNRHITAVGSSGGVSAGAGSTFTNCTFHANQAPLAGSGGALATFDSVIDSCIFTNNTAAEDGGAIFGGGNTIINCQFSQNSAGVDGGAIRGGSNLNVDNCIFEDNFSSFGGAINGFGLIRNSTFIANWAADLGGAIAGGGTVHNCVFLGNYGHPSGIGEGGAISGGGQFANCLFSGNSASNLGSAALVTDSQFSNCTFVGNRLTYTNVSSGAVHQWQNGNSFIDNCVIYFNEANNQQTMQAQITVQNGTLTVRNSCVQGWDGSLPGSNNFADNPQMIDPDGADNAYGTEDDNPRLSDSSPGRDAGDNALVAADRFDLDGDGNTTERLPIDLDGLRRIVNGIVDRGAYEWQRVAGCDADVSPSTPGVAGDGQINVNDLLTILNAWGTCDQCVADVDGDGFVNVNDLLSVINSWGGCP